MNAIIQQGNFTSDGNAKTLKIRSDVDWIKIVNKSETAKGSNGYGVEYYWQLGMGTDTIMKYRPAADQTVASDVSATSIQVIDSSSFAVGASKDVSVGTNAAQPVYSTASTTGLANGGIVRLDTTAHSNLNGLDFSVDTVNVDADFRLANAIATAPGVVAGALGHYKTIAPNIEIYRMFTPSNRVIANITAAASAVVTTLVDHGYAVGESVKFNVPSAFGMIQMDGLTGVITAVTAGTFTVGINSTAFTAYNFPLPAIAPFTPAMCVVIGDSPLYSGYMNAPGKFYNQGFIGVVLAGGTTGPGGNNTNEVYWYAGKSERVDNEIL